MQSYILPYSWNLFPSGSQNRFRINQQAFSVFRNQSAGEPAFVKRSASAKKNVPKLVNWCAHPSGRQAELPGPVLMSSHELTPHGGSQRSYVDARQ